MILPGQFGAGHQVRLLSGAYKHTKKQSDKSTLEVIWPEHLWEVEEAFQDQKESFQYQTDYLLRFMPKRMFDLKHKLVDTTLWENESYHFRSCLFVGDPKRQSKTKKIRYDCCKTVKFKNFHKRKKDKVTLFRDTFVHHGKSVVGNAHRGKRPLSYNKWEIFIEYLRKYFDVTEIEYRTPISEVMYHLQTCGVVLGYMGMWSEHASLLNTPMIHLVDFSNFPKRYLMMYEDYNEKELLEKRIYDFSARNYNSITAGNHTLEDLININYFKGLVERAKSVIHNRNA